MAGFENFPTEHSEIIRKINAGAITAQSGAADLKEALLLTVAACRDYRRYASTLGGLLEDFDESLEVYDPNTWFFRGTEKADELATECYTALGAASRKLDDLENRAAKSCAGIVKTVLTAPPATQKLVLGRAYEIKPEETDERIGELLELLGEAEYHQAMQENLAAFLKLMEEEWSANAQR
jgi:hypothetical protein